jgi:hypothetical protein
MTFEESWAQEAKRFDGVGLLPRAGQPKTPAFSVSTTTASSAQTAPVAARPVPDDATTRPAAQRTEEPARKSDSHRADTLGLMGLFGFLLIAVGVVVPNRYVHAVAVALLVGMLVVTIATGL